MPNNSIFEKTMSIILEDKRKRSANASTKKLKESLKTKSRKVEDEIIDKEIDAEDEEVMDDIADDIVVVIDPDISEDEFDDMAEDAQEIIDNTPEGEVPFTDEYVGDKTYTCPICGNTFFSDVEMSDGDECPVCGDFPSGFLLAGEVVPTEEVEDQKAEEDEDEDEDIMDVDVEESVKHPNTKSKKEDLEITVDDEGDLGISEVDKKDEEEELVLDADAICDGCIDKDCTDCNDVVEYALDESTFNPILTKFVKENYKNAKSFRLVGAKVRGNQLTLECKLRFESGKIKNVNMLVKSDKPVLEVLKRAKKFSMTAIESGTFTKESKSIKPSFMFTCTMNNNIIKCEEMKYNFISKVKHEGKEARLNGKIVTESKRATKKSSK